MMPDRPSKPPSFAWSLSAREPRRGGTWTAALLAILAWLALVPASHAFCGFFVAKADSSLFNRASQVVLVRDDDRTVITMANDYEGDPSEFAMVIPVPTFIEEEQINVAEPALLAQLDAYSAPRLVEYFDRDPCAPDLEYFSVRSKSADLAGAGMVPSESAAALGVTIEAQYTVGEYDILILSAEQSDGLVTWLVQNGYKLPKGASQVVDGYLKQGMHFFVAKVNVGEQAKLGVQRLRPIQVAYESPKFMLPIRLGMVNAAGPQELFVYTLTRGGRVETTNYRTVKLPTGDEIPPFVKDEFADFYRALFDEQVGREDMRAVFLEYAWDMSWCDPCAADPLSPEQLRALGVMWDVQGGQPRGGPARDVFVTRLHLRYDAEHFPEDLRFQQTADRSSFQGRYVLRHPFTGEAACEAGERYRAGLPERLDREAQTLATLTGWEIDEIRSKLPMLGGTSQETQPLPAGADAEKSWWRRIWDR